MKNNHLLEIFRQRKTAVAGWMSIDSAYAAELVGCSGFDSVVVDCQHGMAGHAQMVAMLQALSHTPAVPLVRVSQNSLAEINRALDAGAYGIICPLVNSAAEAQAFGRACRYPLGGVEGDRSFGPARGLLVGGADYPQHANEQILALAMIETLSGLDAVEAIAAVPQIDGLFIGPSDLGIALGLGPGANHEHPVLANAIRRIQEAARAAGKVTCIWCSTAEMARAMRAQGMDLVVPGHDAIWLKAEIARRLAVLRSQD
ncbi:HpcH/HpaI aldolase family protein [Roseateles violae]|uniref:Aldolase/citrate lyase family protein n=1 Tax=Roseateles violae TaxID=3058042 RepID=A0ABT8DLV3_9BURK|nr:aldolase/citrate lyase family protein [Pelomonas sp. PFR6]MDN3919391.1 aldolase/citrate lyase family protein [Pelomonas sp. PFR6]